ncbi:uncharacterized protein [Setaria viridis]|uniref:uncharacterized protein n=1 Tax=Setaria viridis TaxID=4556 RepID=UPI003B3AF1A8
MTEQMHCFYVSGSCSIAACTMCIEAQHRLAFERVNGSGSFTFKAKVPSELKKACYKGGIWSSEDEAHIHEVLNAIARKGGVLTERLPNKIKLPISVCHYLDDIGGYQLMRLICAHGPVIGTLWAAFGDYDRTTGDIVYRGTPKEYRFPGSGDYHVVVCFAYKYDSRREELHIRVMDNHAEDGPLRWISFPALDEFYLPLISEPVELRKLRRKKKREEQSVSAYVTHSMVTLERKLMTWIRCRELDRFFKPRQQDIFLLDNELRHAGQSTAGVSYSPRQRLLTRGREPDH